MTMKPKHTKVAACKRTRAGKPRPAPCDEDIKLSDSAHNSLRFLLHDAFHPLRYLRAESLRRSRDRVARPASAAAPNNMTSNPHE